MFHCQPGDGEVLRIEFSPDGKPLTAKNVFSSGYGNPMDLTASDDTFFIAEYGPDQITALRWIDITGGTRLIPKRGGWGRPLPCASQRRPQLSDEV